MRLWPVRGVQAIPSELTCTGTAFTRSACCASALAPAHECTQRLPQSMSPVCRSWKHEAPGGLRTDRSVTQTALSRSSATPRRLCTFPCIVAAEASAVRLLTDCMRDRRPARTGRVSDLAVITAQGGAPTQRAGRGQRQWRDDAGQHDQRAEEVADHAGRFHHHHHF